MNQEQQIKKIVAIFLKVDESAIGTDTLVDRSAVKGSIMIHRMHAAITRELKTSVNDYNEVKTFGDLLQAYHLAAPQEEFRPAPQALKTQKPTMSSHNQLAIGIDIEVIDKMPKVADFKEDAFYKQNFGPDEIAYCLRQANPLESLAGKFAAKEAIVKADNSLKGTPFSQIEIKHDSEGKPYFADFAISISHADRFAVAVAVKNRV